MNDVYRAAASILVLCPQNTGGDFPYHVLLLHKPRKQDSWQLPQGGAEEGEDTAQTALRELSEEAGIHSAKLIGKGSDVYQYDFPASYRRFRPDNVRGQRIEFVIATVPADTVVQVDRKEVDKFVWVSPSDLQRYIRRKEYLELVYRLIEEAREMM